MEAYEERMEKIMARIHELAACSDDDHAITRIFGSASFIKASRIVLSWMKEAGLEARIDNIGNIRGRLVSGISNAKTFLLASHIDSVVNAGKFDGPLGVIMALDLVEQLVQSSTLLPFNLEIIAFCDEEGVRFHSTFLGSRVVAGTFDNTLLQKKDAAGTSLSEVMHSMGGNYEILQQDAIAAGELLGYFEIHIEQGPVLYEKGFPAAIVRAIAGQQRTELVFKGFAGHAGTVPMDMRQDALCAAAACILEIENIALAHKHKMVATAGKLDIRNAASNVIPGEVTCSLDLRSEDATLLEDASKKIRQFCEAVCKKRNIVFEWKPVQATSPVLCDTAMNELLEGAIKECGYKALSLVSGAGHDAVAMSAITPVSMLFVRCFKGISHNPLENVEPGDLRECLKIAEKFIHKLILKYPLH